MDPMGPEKTIPGWKNPQGICLYRGFPVPELVDSAEALEVGTEHVKMLEVGFLFRNKIKGINC